jgi:hypothetical protein
MFAHALSTPIDGYSQALLPLLSTACDGLVAGLVLRRHKYCAVTCQYQPICGVCQTPCNPMFNGIEVIPGVLPTQPSGVQSLNYSYSSAAMAVNPGSSPQTISVTFSITQQLAVTLQYAEAFQYNEQAAIKVCTCLLCIESLVVRKEDVHGDGLALSFFLMHRAQHGLSLLWNHATANVSCCMLIFAFTSPAHAHTQHMYCITPTTLFQQIGVPFMNDGKLEFGSQQTFTTTTKVSDTRTTSYQTALQQQIPPMTVQQVNASATADTITTRIPVTIKTYYTCDKTDTKDTFAIIKTQGTLSATASQLNVTYGPSYPIG